MIIFISIIHVIVCLMLIGIILLQPGRGQGLTGAAFGDSSQSVFGTKTADVLTKATTAAAVLFMVTCVVLSAVTARKSRSLYDRFQNQAPITMNQIQKAVAEAEQKAKSAKSSAAEASDTAAKTADSAVKNTLAAAEAAAKPAAEEPKAA